jgi:hypothetical protein
LTLKPPDPTKPCTREYVAQGAKFAKWRAALRVVEGSCPSDLAVKVNAEQLAAYAAICQVRAWGDRGTLHYITLHYITLHYITLRSPRRP